MNTENLTITIVGGGASAHTLIPLLSSSKYIVNLLTRKPDLWSKKIELQYQAFNGDVIESFHGELNKISSEPEDVINEADVIFLCMPVSQYRNALHRITPHLNPDSVQHVSGSGSVLRVFFLLHSSRFAPCLSKDVTEDGGPCWNMQIGFGNS